MGRWSVTVEWKGERVVLEHGDLIGRSERAKLRIDSPVVSEFHANVVRRGGSFYLIARAGDVRLHADRDWGRSAPLTRGAKVVLADSIVLTVVSVAPPFWLRCSSGQDLELEAERYCLNGDGLWVPAEGGAFRWSLDLVEGSWALSEAEAGLRRLSEGDQASLDGDAWVKLQRRPTEDGSTWTRREFLLEDREHEVILLGPDGEEVASFKEKAAKLLRHLHEADGTAVRDRELARRIYADHQTPDCLDSDLYALRQVSERMSNTTTRSKFGRDLVLKDHTMWRLAGVRWMTR